MKTAKRLSLLLCAIFVAAQPVLAQNGEDTRNKAVMTTDDGEQLLNTDEISIIRFDGPKVTVVQPWGATVFDRTLRSLTFLRPLPGMLRLTVKTALNGDDAVTRGVDINGSGQLAASWKAGDQVYVYPDATTTTHIGTLTPETTSAKTSKLTGDVTATGLTSGQTLYLSTKPRNHSFATQTNSLDDLFYYKAEATVTITGGNASIANASFSMAQSVTRFTLQDGSSNAVNATQLVITGGTEDITVTSTPATNVFYVAMPAKASTVYSFTATTSDSREWTGTKTAALVDGKYYRATVTMTKTKLTVTDPSSTMTTAVEAKKDGEANQTYTGSALQLVTAGVSSVGTVYYKATTTNDAPSKGEGWTTTVPTASNAGTYYVWYYAGGNDNYNETAVSATPITVTIDKAAMGTALTADNITIAEATYNGGTAVEPAVTVTLNGQDVSGQFDVTYSNNTNAGTGTVTVTPKSDSNFSGSAVTKDFAIAKAAGTTDPASTMTTAVTAKKDGDNNQSYTGSAMDLVNAGVSSAGTVYYKATTTNDAPAKGEGWTSTVPTASNAGTYYVWYYAGGNDNYNETAVSATPITVTIDKVAPTYTAPTFSALTYTGVAQNLVSSGSSSHGTFTYATSQNGEYSASVPQSTNAGNYTVWYKFTGDENHSDIAATEVTGVSISQKALTITAKAQTIAYGAGIATTTDQVTADGLVSGDAITAVTLTPSTSEVTTSGTITPSAATTTNGIDNYAVTYNTGTLTITAVAASVTSAPAAVAGSLTYSGAAQTLFNAGEASGGTLKYKVTTENSAPTSTDGFKITIDQGTAAGTYYLWYYVEGDGNHTSTAINATGISKAIAAATLSVTASDYSGTYDGAAHGITVTCDGATIKYGETEGSYTQDASPTLTNVGTKTIYYQVTKDNYTTVTGSKTITISQKALTITAKAQTIAYGAGIATTTDQVTADGLVSGDAITAVTLTPSTSEVTTSGTITPSAATTTNGIDNYAVTYNTGTLTITAVAASVANAPAFVSSTLTYSGNDQTLVTAGTASGGTMYYYSSTSSTTPTSSSSGWSTNVPKGGNAGTYYVWYYVDGDTNHTSTAITPLGSKAINRKTIEYADVTLTIKTWGICIRYNQQEGSNDKHIHTNAKSTSQGNFLWTLTVPSSCTVSCDKTSGTISTFSVSGNAASGYTLTLTKTGTTSSAADIYTITVNGGGNYTGTYSFTIKLTNDSYGT